MILQDGRERFLTVCRRLDAMVFPKDLARAFVLYGVRLPGVPSLLQKCNTMSSNDADVELLDMRVRDELETLAVDVRARFRRIVELIQSHGLEQMREPHVKASRRQLVGDAYEGKDGISRRSFSGDLSRAIYVTTEPCVVVVRVFVKKTERTPRREINLALERAKEVNDR